MGVLKFAGLVVVLFSAVNTAGADKAYIDALTFGADAAINVLGCDGAGHPIEGGECQLCLLVPRFEALAFRDRHYRPHRALPGDREMHGRCAYNG